MQRKLRTHSYCSLGAFVNPASRKKAEDALPRRCVTARGLRNLTELQKSHGI